MAYTTDMGGVASEVDKEIERNETPFWRFVGEFCSSRLALAALIFFLILVVSVLIAPLFLPQNPYDLRQLDLLDGLLPPGTRSSTGKFTFWLGSDNQGRDMLSAIFYGLRISLFVGIGAALIAMIVGTSLGLFAAYVGGRTESLIMRLVDLQLSFPSMLVALILLSILGRGLFNVILAIMIVEWATYARNARAVALAELQKEYIQAAECLVIPMRRLIYRHLLPNCLPPLIVIATVQVAHGVTLEATLSFLGLGVPITEPSLGLLISNGYRYMLSSQYWLSFYPGLALLAIIASINIVGDQLRDVLNPRGHE